MLVAALLAGAAPLPACTWERAHYEQVGDARYTVDVQPFAYESPIQHISIVLRMLGDDQQGPMVLP